MQGLLSRWTRSGTASGSVWNGSIDSHDLSSYDLSHSSFAMLWTLTKFGFLWPRAILKFNCLSNHLDLGNDK